MKQFFLILLILVGTLPLLSAQTKQEETMVKELTALREHYQNLSSFSVDINYRLYVGSSTKAEESFTAHLIRKGKQHRLTSKEQVSIVNNSHAITVNHTEKMVLIQQSGNAKSEVDPSAIDIAILLKLSHKTTELKGLANGNRGYRFEFYNSQYKNINVIYNSDNYYIQKIILEAHAPKDQESQRLEISYSNMNPIPSIVASTFSTKKYIVIKDQKVSLIAPYKAYKLIN